MQNTSVSTSSAEQSVEVISSGYIQIRAYLMTGFSIAIGLVGVLGNSASMYVMRSSRKINQSKSFTMLMNQCLVDCVMSVLVTSDLFLMYALPSGDGGSFYCYVIHSTLMPTTMVLISSYNLVALSLDRMVSVVWPIRHRVLVTKRRWICVGIWCYGLCLTLALSLPVNGPRDDGSCHFWNKFSSRLNAQVFSVIFNTFYRLLPIALMLVSYTVIYITVSTISNGSKVKMNVI